MSDSRPSPKQASPSGYDKYVNYRTFSVAVGAFLLLLLLPTPDSMTDVGVEVSQGRARARDLISRRLFDSGYDEAAQWQAATSRWLEHAASQGVTDRAGVLKNDLRQLRRSGVSIRSRHYDLGRSLLRSTPPGEIGRLLRDAQDYVKRRLSLEMLDEAERAAARGAAWKIKVCVALVAFVVVCFVSECLPLPGVAFCIGLILVLFGLVSRREVASLYWSDACWFIMGSLMFAAAFVKTGVDKRICLLLFKRLARPRVELITAILILVIAPAASFISDHALAAMFLPIAIILYVNSLDERIPADPELAKMLVICICMACNIGGFGSPSGGARNVIIMTYLEDMFGITVGYGEWMMYAMPFVLVMMPALWLLLRWRFKPRIQDVGQALETLRRDIARMGGWSRQQLLAVAIFLLMLLGWITEKGLLKQLIGFRLGIGVVAVAGAVAYLIAGVVNWRDYQERVDWGVVWLYAGAIIFGRVLDETGAAYWLARSVVEQLARLGLASGFSLLALGSAVTAGLTNLMADGPAAAAVGPVTLNMAAVSNPNTALVPFMGLATACASSFAYLLVIGTPPNAIVYASGYLQPRDYLRVGIPCFALAFAALLLLVRFYWTMLGFQGLAPA